MMRFMMMINIIISYVEDCEDEVYYHDHRRNAACYACRHHHHLYHDHHHHRDHQYHRHQNDHHHLGMFGFWICEAIKAGGRGLVSRDTRNNCSDKGHQQPNSS